MTSRRFPPPWSVEELWRRIAPGRSCPDFSLGCGPIALFSGQTTLDDRPQPGEPAGASMWDERKMPERWYELLRERMQVEQQRMSVIQDGDIIEHDNLEELLARADSLDHEMLLVMRQATAAPLKQTTRPLRFTRVRLSGARA